MFTSRTERDKGQLHLSCQHVFGLEGSICFWIAIQYQSNTHYGGPREARPAEESVTDYSEELGCFPAGGDGQGWGH